VSIFEELLSAVFYNGKTEKLIISQDENVTVDLEKNVKLCD